MAYTFKYGDRPLEGIAIQRAVGRGGFGEVYYALTDSGKQVALKYLRDNPDIELRGISHVMNLKSPHLITIYDVRRNNEGDPFVIMEYVSGPSLRDLLVAEPNGLGAQKAAFFLCNIAAGLNYLHERGIVHRDLKPGNIFYDDGYVKIGDYGLSKHISVSRHSGQTVSVGTVHYMAPEIGSGTYTKAIDIYALGVILYEMITGRLPFTGSSMGEVLMRHLSEQPDVSGIPEPFAKVIAKALAKNPQDRYQDVDEMVDVVRASTEVSASIASFDPATLSGVARGEPVEDADRTVTTPPKPPPKPPPVPPLDARAAREPVLAQPISDEQARRAHRGARAGRRVDATFERLGLDPRKRRPQVFTLLVVVVAVAMGLGLISGHGDWAEATVAVALFLVGGTIGPLLAYFKILQRNLTRNSFLDRIVYAGTGVVFMIPAIGMSAEELSQGFARLAIPIAGVLFLCDWTKRIEDGRRQKIRGGHAVWPAILGLIGAAMVDADKYMWIGAGMCATLSLLTQATAAMWPFAALTGPGRPPAPAECRVGIAVVDARGRLKRAGEQVARVVGQTAEAVERAGHRISQAVERTEGQAEQKEPPEAQQAVQTVYVDPSAPSFVGRTANAGLSFIAKLLLLAGVTAAVFFPSTTIIATSEYGGMPTTVQWQAGKIVEVCPTDGPFKTYAEIPPAAVLAPLALGTILLIAARRNDGAAHFLRGFFGCAFAFVAVIVALAPASGAIQKFFDTNNWSELDDDTVAALIGTAVLLALSLALLFWPRRQRNKPVVI